MSSLAAARADNFYYPPDFDPKKGSLNKVVIVHFILVKPIHISHQSIKQEPN